MALEENSWARMVFDDVLEHRWGALFSLICVHLSYTIISKRWFSPLSKFPGPFWGSITDLYSVYVKMTGTPHLVHYELHKKYGKHSIRIIGG